MKDSTDLWEVCAPRGLPVEFFSKIFSFLNFYARADLTGIRNDELSFFNWIEGKTKDQLLEWVFMPIRIKFRVFLDNFPFLRQNTLIFNMTPRVYFKGETIIEPNSLPEGIFFINEGRVLIQVKTQLQELDGTYMTCWKLNPGLFFGENCIIERKINAKYVVASKELKVLFLPKEVLERVLEQLGLYRNRLKSKWRDRHIYYSVVKNAIWCQCIFVLEKVGTQKNPKSVGKPLERTKRKKGEKNAFEGRIPHVFTKRENKSLWK